METNVSDTVQGLRQNLVVVVRHYVPSVLCQIPSGAIAPPAGSCASLLGLLPVGTEQAVFGRKNVEGTEVALPRTFRLSKLLSLPFGVV